MSQSVTSILQRRNPILAGSTSVRWRILALLMGLCFISHFNRASMASAGDERIMTQFAISAKEMGLVYSAFLIVYTIFMIPGGFFIDRYGPRMALTLMGFGSALFCAVTGMVGWGLVAAGQVLITLIVVRSWMGLFTAPLHPASARAASNWFPDRQRVLANGLITGASLLAYACVHPMFGALIDWFDWTNSFLILGACTALLAGLWLVYARDHPCQHPSANDPERQLITGAMNAVKGGDAGSRPSRITFGDVISLARDRSLICLTLSYAAVGYFQYLFFYWMHYYFDSVLHLGKTESRFYAAMPTLAMAFCMPFGGWLTGKAQQILGHAHGRTLVPKAGMLGSAVLLLLGIVAQEAYWIVLWFTCSLGVLGLCEGAFWTTAVELGGARGGTAAAVINTGGNGVGLLAPVVTPAISEALGWSWGIGMGAVVAILGSLCWWWIEPRQQSVGSGAT